MCLPGCRQILPNSYLVSSAPPCFLPSSQPDGDRRQGTDNSVSTSLVFPEDVGRREGGRGRGERETMEGKKETGCEDRDGTLPYRSPPSGGGGAAVCRRLPPSISLYNVLSHQSRPKTEDDRKLLHTLKTSVHAEWLQSCLTLCNSLDCSPSGSSIHGILQARIVEGTVMPSSRGSSQLRDQTSPALAGGFCTTSTTWEAHLKPGLGSKDSSPFPPSLATTTQAQVHHQSLVCNRPKQSPWGFLGGASGKARA